MGVVSNSPAEKAKAAVLPGGVWQYSGSGAPTSGSSGTLAGKAAPGSTYTDYLNGVEYLNAGTKAAPTWIAASSAQMGQVVKVSVTSAQIKTLHSAPTTIVPAPGAGLYLVPTQFAINLVFGTTQYASGGAVSLIYHGGSTALHSGTVPAAVINAGASSVTLLGPQAGSNGLTLVANTGIDISAATGDFTTGDGTLDVIIWYATISL